MKEKIMVGYDLGNHYSQISYCTYDGKEPETLSVVAGRRATIFRRCCVNARASISGFWKRSI